MRVLHVITGLDVGGAEHQLRLLLRHLPYPCEVATLTNPGPVADAIRADGTTVHHLAMGGNRDLSVVPKLVRLIRAGRFDLVHTHLYRACVHGRVAAWLAGVPHIVATEHSLGDGLIEGRATTPAVRALYLATERLGDTTIAVSRSVADRLAGWRVPASRLTVVPNGIDAAEFSYDPVLRAGFRARHGIAPSARVIGAVGRLQPTKRFDLLLDALPALPGATLLLVGDGPARAALHEQAYRLGVADRVVFAGAAGHTREALCAMDAFAAPSERETFGMAVLEALACGLPATYVSCPALTELPGTAAPYARQVVASPAALVASLRADLALLEPPGGPGGPGPGRRPVPPAVARYSVARLGGAVANCYERVLANPRSHPENPRYRTAGSEGS